MNAVSAQVVSCYVYDKRKKIMKHMQGTIPFVFDCWADPVVLLILLNTSAVITSDIGASPSARVSTTTSTTRTMTTKQFEMF